MTDTPRTDSQLLTVKDCSYVAPHPSGEYVHANFARLLERENAALRAEKEILDWLEAHAISIWVPHRDDQFAIILPTREAIQQARKEGHS